jgi:selenocysteine lyase/cysteine desulfurase
LLETGTLGHEAIVGSAAAVEFLAALGEGPDRRARLDSAFHALHERGEALVRRLWEGLDAIPGVRLYGPGPGRPRTPTVGFTVEGYDAEAVTAHLSRHEGIFTSHGDFYATTVIEDLGVAPQGLVRAGCACYTTEDEVDRLIGGVAALPRP